MGAKGNIMNDQNVFPLIFIFQSTRHNYVGEEDR